MTEDAWMNVLGEKDSKLSEILPILKDWYEESGEEGKAAFCKWLLWREARPAAHHYRNGLNSPVGWYWRKRTWNKWNDLPAPLFPHDLPAPLFPHDLPAPLFHRGLRTDPEPQIYGPNSGEDFPDRKTAWWEAFKAWARAYEAGELEPWMEMMNPVKEPKSDSLHPQGL